MKNKITFYIFTRFHHKFSLSKQICSVVINGKQTNKQTSVANMAIGMDLMGKTHRYCILCYFPRLLVVLSPKTKVVEI